MPTVVLLDPAVFASEKSHIGLFSGVKKATFYF
jgi:hypothetical protein